MTEEVHILDVKGLSCPMPLLKAKKALNEMAGGELIRVLATDPGSVRDFDVFPGRVATNCWIPGKKPACSTI